MPSGATAVFGEPDEFQAALRQDGVANLLVVSSGQFCARLTKVTLHGWHLSACNEQLPRIAFVKVPADTVVVAFSISDQRRAPSWGGVQTRADEIITLSSGEQIHARTEGRCSWGLIRLPREDLAQYARELSGVEVVLPPVARWRPPRGAFRQLRHFHRAAIRAVESRSAPLIDSQAAHGLEQQAIHALVECLSTGIAQEETLVARSHRAILARFEDRLCAKRVQHASEISTALDIPERTMLACCNSHLGMGPGRYLRLRRMQAVHRVLQGTDPRVTSLSDVAMGHGIRDLGRFAQAYHALYGEFPSDTLRGPYKIALLEPSDRS